VRFSATIGLVIELAVALAAAVVIGLVRPRWSTLSVALVPTALAFAWLLLHEDIPGEATALGDVVWYVAMSLMVGAAFALACLLGIVVRRTGGRRRTAPQL
jgi:hypothetical protein